MAKISCALFPLFINKNRKIRSKQLFLFPFWQILIKEFQKKFKTKVYNGKIKYPHYISDFKYDKKLKYKLQNGRKCLKKLEKFRPDFILQYNVEPYLKTQESKVFTIMDTVPEYSFSAKNINVKKEIQKKAFIFEKSYLDKVKHIFTISNHLKKYIIKKYKLPKSKISVACPGSIFTALTTKRKQKRKKHVTFLSIGIPFEEKMGKELLMAFYKVRKKYPKVKLNIVSILKKNKYKNLLQNVKTIPYIPYSTRKNLAKIYKNSDIYISATKKTLYPNTIIDAMAFGLPVIATDVFGATKEIIKKNKTSGLLVKYDEKIVENLYKKMIYLLKHPILAKKLGDRSYIKYQKYYTMKQFVNCIIKTIIKKTK